MDNKVLDPPAVQQPPAPPAPKPFDPNKFRGITIPDDGSKPIVDTPAPAPDPEPPADTPADPEPTTDPEPTVEPEHPESPATTAGADDEFNFNTYVPEDTGTQQPPVTPKSETDWSAVAKELGIRSTKAEDIIAEIKAQREEAVENYRNDPVAKIDKILSSDKTLMTVAYYQDKHGMTADQARRYVEEVLIKRGDDAMASEHFIAQTHFENKKSYIESNRQSIEDAQAQKDLQLQSELKSIIASQKDVFTVPVEQGKNDKFADWFFSGEFGKSLQNPKTLIDVARFTFEKNAILKSVSDNAMEKGKKIGYNEAKSDYEKKIHNKDTKEKSSNARGEARNLGTKKPGFDPDKFIENVKSAINGQMQPPQQ